MVPAGGTITIGDGGGGANTASVIFIRPGAVLDASGTSAVIDQDAGLPSSLSPLPWRVAGLGQRPDGKWPATAARLTLAPTVAFISTAHCAHGRWPDRGGRHAGYQLITPLYVRVNANSVPNNLPDYFRVPYELIVNQVAAPTLVPADLQPGDGSVFTAAASALIGKAAIGVDQITAGGFDNVSLTRPT